MPESFFCCIPLKWGANIVGLVQLAGVAVATWIIVASIANQSNVGVLQAIGIYIAYTLPAFSWLFTLCYDHSVTKKIYAGTYFVCHAFTELVALIVPIVLLWSHRNDQTTLTRTVGSSTFTYTVRQYLWVNSAFWTFWLLILIYVTSCLWSNATRKSRSELEAQQREPLNYQQYPQPQYYNDTNRMV